MSRSAATISPDRAPVQHWSNLPRRLRSIQVLVRFGFRLLVLVVFASFAGIGLNRSPMALFWMATLLCGVIASIRQEPEWTSPEALQ